MYSAVASSVPRQSKVVLQRLYREKEGESFNALRDAINELTGEALQTRQEILRKATDLLSTASKVRKLKEAQAVNLVPYEENVEDSAMGHVGQPIRYHPIDGALGHSALPSSSGLQNWYYCPEFDSRPASQSHDQHHTLFTMDSVRNPASPRGYAEVQPDYQYFRLQSI